MDIKELKEIIADETTEFPEITHDDAKRAYMTSLMKITDKYDAFYYFASMNLLNAYVKKPYVTEEFKKRYVFKNYVIKGIEQVVTNNIDEVKIYFTLSVTYIFVMGFQFSFHNLNSTFTINSYINGGKNIEQEWSGLRLQPPAALIYKVAEEIHRTKKKQDIA